MLEKTIGGVSEQEGAIDLEKVSAAAADVKPKGEPSTSLSGCCGCCWNCCCSGDNCHWLVMELLHSSVRTVQRHKLVEKQQWLKVNCLMHWFTSAARQNLVVCGGYRAHMVRSRVCCCPHNHTTTEKATLEVSVDVPSDYRSA